MAILVSREFVNEIRSMTEEAARRAATNHRIFANDWDKPRDCTLVFQRATNGNPLASMRIDLDFECLLPIEQCDISEGLSRYNRAFVGFSTAHYAAACAIVLTAKPGFRAEQYDKAGAEFDAAIEAHEAAQGLVPCRFPWMTNDQ